MARPPQNAKSTPEELSDREAEEIFNVNTEQLHERLGHLLAARWPELLREDTPVGRRARTLGTCAALRETRQLADFAHRAEEDDLRKSRGEKMLPDVAEEPRTLLTQDQCLKRRPALRDALQAAIPSLRQAEQSDAAPKISRNELERFSSLLRSAEGDYLELCMQSLVGQFNEKGSLVQFEEVLEQLASHARSIGWSDEGLISLWEQVAATTSDPEERVKTLCKELRQPPEEYDCVVRVILCGHSSHAIFNVPDYGVLTHERDGAVDLSVKVSARDPWTAAATAITRVGTIIGAPNVFQLEPNRLAEHPVTVAQSKKTVEIHVRPPVVRDHHNPRRDQIARIVAVASGGEMATENTLYEVIRNHHRALNESDVESAFILLWNAMERVCANPSRPEPALTSTADLISSAMAFSKIRREVQNLAEDLGRFLKSYGLLHRMKLHRIDDEVIRDERDVVPHWDVLAALIGTPDDARNFCTAFYEDVRLTQWFFRLRRQLASPTGSTGIESLKHRVPDMIEASRKRTRWQVLRLYRARNHLAHGASWTLWLSDLSRHANYLLTNTIAICLNYASEPGVSARAILERRSGWLDAYLALARKGDQSALSIDALLTPSMLFKSRPSR
jgi:hypothetical protein